jgi:hypothetical protein
MTDQKLVNSTVAFIETYYWKYKRLPASDEDLFREYFVETDIAEVLSEAKYLKYLAQQGVPVDGTPTLNPKQVRWIDSICAAGDSRPIGVKAKEANVTMSQHNAWLKNPLFQGALTSRLESILPDERVRVHSALAREASGGNVSAIKLYLQLTGEYTEGTQSDKSEVAGLMQGILEILESHVPRNVLTALADDFDYLLVHGSPPARRVVPRAPERVGLIEALELRVNDDLT